MIFKRLIQIKKKKKRQSLLLLMIALNFGFIKILRYPSQIE